MKRVNREMKEGEREQRREGKRERRTYRWQIVISEVQNNVEDKLKELIARK